jgi:sulfate transport system permease protein
MVLLPVATVVNEGLRDGPAKFAAALAEPSTWSALRLTLGVAVAMAVVNAVMGTWIAYLLVRVKFPGRAVVNALVDLPFAIPTLVTGVMLVVLFGPDSAIGAFSQRHGLRLMYAPTGIVLALLFVTLPFVVRAVQPVLMEADAAEEEAAMTLGASPAAAFRRVLLPTIAPAILTGTMLGFARALGEFGSIVVVSGNVPGRTLTAAVLVYGEIESGRPEVAAAVSTVLIALAYATLLLIERVQRRIRGAA